MRLHCHCIGCQVGSVQPHLYTKCTCLPKNLHKTSKCLQPIRKNPVCVHQQVHRTSLIQECMSVLPALRGMVMQQRLCQEVGLEQPPHPTTTHCSQKAQISTRQKHCISESQSLLPHLPLLLGIRDRSFRRTQIFSKVTQCSNGKVLALPKGETWAPAVDVKVTVAQTEYI